jgi:hypothetical protein
MKNTSQKLGFFVGFLVIVFMFFAFGIVYVQQLKDREIAKHNLDTTIEQINEMLLPALEENLQKLDEKIEALIKEDERLKDNCSDIRALLVPKLGRNVLVPLQRMREPKLVSEPEDVLPRIRYSR